MLQSFEQLPQDKHSSWDVIVTKTKMEITAERFLGWILKFSKTFGLSQEQFSKAGKIISRILMIVISQMMDR